MVSVEEAAGGPGPIPQGTPAAKSPLIMIVGADKGGVGKTTVTRALLDYLEKNEVPIRAIDTEPGETGVLKRFYPRADMLNINSVPGQMKMVDSATAKAVTVVDAHANLLSPILKSFHKIDIMDDVRRGALRLMVLHVIGPTVASTSEVPAVVAALHGAHLVQVRNYVNEDAVFVDDPVQPSIDIPNLDETSCEAVDRAGEMFAAFIADNKNSRVLRGYVRAWLNDVHASFDRVVGPLVR